MRITYVAHTRFPTEKAHGHQMAQVCDALAELGHSVTLVAPTVRNAIKDEPHTYYGIPKSFHVIHPGTFDALGSRFVPGKLGFMIGMWSYRRVLKDYLKDHASDLLYTRSPSVLPALLHTGTPVILELHTLPNFLRRRFVRLCGACHRVVCLTSLQRESLIAWGADPSNIVVEADGVDLSRFESIPAPSVARKEWDLPEGVPVIGYAGSLITRRTVEKGVGELITALSLLKKAGRKHVGLIAGGPASQKDIYEEQARKLGLSSQDIRFLGPVPAADVPRVIAAFDIAVYPAPASRHAYFWRDTSPLKLFEYLAAGRPIACADLPPLRDIVDESIVRFCKAGDPASLAECITWLLDHQQEAEKMAEKGKEIVKQHSWTKRMERIIGEA